MTSCWGSSFSAIPHLTTSSCLCRDRPSLFLLHLGDPLAAIESILGIDHLVLRPSDGCRDHQGASTGCNRDTCIVPKLPSLNLPSSLPRLQLKPQKQFLILHIRRHDHQKRGQQQRSDSPHRCLFLNNSRLYPGGSNVRLGCSYAELPNQISYISRSILLISLQRENISTVNPLASSIIRAVVTAPCASITDG